MLNISFILLLVGFGIDAEITRRQADRTDAVDPKVTFGTVDAVDAELPVGSGDAVDAAVAVGSGDAVDNDTNSNNRINLIEPMAVMEKLTGENFENSLRQILDAIEEAMGSSANNKFSISALLIVFSIMLI